MSHGAKMNQIMTIIIFVQLVSGQRKTRFGEFKSKLIEFSQLISALAYLLAVLLAIVG